jgi:hypothetical protein
MAPRMPHLESSVPVMSDAKMDDALKTLRDKTRKSPPRRLPAVAQGGGTQTWPALPSPQAAEEVPVKKRYGGPPPRKKTQAELQKERKMQVEKELDSLNLSLSSIAKRPAPVLMPILDFASKARRSLHASGAQTDRPAGAQRKALHEHKVPYRPAAGSLSSDTYSTILDL